MLGQLVRKELLEHLMGLRFAIACVLCFIVVLSSLFVRCRDHVQMLDDHNENRTIEEARRKNIRHPHYLVEEGVNVHKRPASLGIFVRGSGEAATAVRITGRDEAQIVAGEVKNPPELLFPSMDVIAFVGIIMSLLAIVFGYDAVCGEKERGTLRLMLSYSVPRDTVLLGKWIGGYVALVVPFLLAVTAGAMIVLAQTSISVSAGEWARLLGIVLVSLLYVAVVYSAALYVSCLTSRSATSVMVLLTVWMVLVLAVPNLSPYLAQAWVPTKNADEVRAAKLKAREEAVGKIAKKMEEYDKIHFEPGRPWYRQINWRDSEDRKRGRKRQVHERQIQLDCTLEALRAVARIESDLARRIDVQAGLGNWVARVSPFSSFAMSSTALADTGPRGTRRFIEQVRGYQERLVRYAYAEWMARYRYELEKGERPPSWSDPENREAPLPVFVYTPPAATEYLKMMALDTALLAAAAVLFFMLSYVTFLRYDVR
ncbi:MAG: ABC transporter permease subunit [Planctomycetota bacterium]|jgi:ABC-type transport system involved in multi-copper enzyme maturation permease subunit